MNNLKPWDGKFGHYQHDIEQVKDWNMQISDDGAIWYYTHEKIPQLSVWCPASMLRAHMHHLEQIKARA